MSLAGRTVQAAGPMDLGGTALVVGLLATPAAKSTVDALDVNAAVLRGFGDIGDLDDLARCRFRIGEGTGVTNCIPQPCLPCLRAHHDLGRGGENARASFANGAEVPGNGRIKMGWDCKNRVREINDLTQNPIGYRQLSLKQRRLASAVGPLYTCA